MSLRRSDCWRIITREKVQDLKASRNKDFLTCTYIDNKADKIKIIIKNMLQLWSLTLCLLSPARLVPLYFSAQVLWVLIGFSCLGVLLTSLRLYLNLDILEGFLAALSSDWPVEERWKNLHLHNIVKWWCGWLVVNVAPTLFFYVVEKAMIWLSTRGR